MHLSVVVPCFNGQKQLNSALSTLLNQTTPAHEIIVVDDGSERPISVPHGVRLIRIDRQPEYRGSSAAKNAGAAAATGDWLAFTDDDILHMPDAVESACNSVRDIDREDVLLTVFSIGVPEGMLDIIDWKAGDSESMECLLGCFRDQGKLYAATHADGVIASPKVGPVTGLIVDVNEAMVVSSEQHFGVISRGFFDSLGGYDSAAFPSWGFNNQDLCLRVVKAGGTLISNIIRSNGEVLHCFHARPSPHDPAIAKQEFYAKYGAKFSPFMLLKPGETCLTRR